MLHTGYDTGDEVGVVSGLFEFPADKRDGTSGRRLAVLAQISQKCVRVQTFRQNALNDPVWQSYYLTNIVDSLPTICKDNRANVWYVFRGCACRRSSGTLIVVDRRSSVLEAFVP
jgi:hypothetical protein